MAIYHLEAKIISRGSGRSAVAAAAYMSCSRIYNDYDGITHDYTRKRGLVWEQIFYQNTRQKNGQTVAHCGMPLKQVRNPRTAVWRGS